MQGGGGGEQGRSGATSVPLPSHFPLPPATPYASLSCPFLALLLGSPSPPSFPFSHLNTPSQLTPTPHSPSPGPNSRVDDVPQQSVLAPQLPQQYTHHRAPADGSTTQDMH